VQERLFNLKIIFSRRRRRTESTGIEGFAEIGEKELLKGSNVINEGKFFLETPDVADDFRARVIEGFSMLQME
jgi:hypothetical protein